MGSRNLISALCCGHLNCSFHYILKAQWWQTQVHSLESESLCPALCFLHQPTRAEDPSAFSALRTPFEVLRRAIIIPTHLYAPFSMLTHLPASSRATVRALHLHNSAPLMHSKHSFCAFFPNCLPPPSLLYLWDQACWNPSLLLSATEWLQLRALNIIPQLWCHLPLIWLLHFAPQGESKCVLQRSLIINWAKTP